MVRRLGVPILRVNMVVILLSKLPASVAQLDAHATSDQEVAGSTPAGRQNSFLEI